MSEWGFGGCEDLQDGVLSTKDTKDTKDTKGVGGVRMGIWGMGGFSGWGIIHEGHERYEGVGGVRMGIWGMGDFQDGLVGCCPRLVGGSVGNLLSTVSRHSGFGTGRMDSGETPALP